MNDCYPLSSNSFLKIKNLRLFPIFIYSLFKFTKISQQQKRDAYPKKSMHLWKRYRRRTHTFIVRNSQLYRQLVWTMYEISSYKVHMKISHCPFLLLSSFSDKPPPLFCKKLFSVLEGYHFFHIIVNSQISIFLGKGDRFLVPERI